MSASIISLLGFGAGVLTAFFGHKKKEWVLGLEGCVISLFAAVHWAWVSGMLSLEPWGWGAAWLIAFSLLLGAAILESGYYDKDFGIVIAVPIAAAALLYLIFLLPDETPWLVITSMGLVMLLGIILYHSYYGEEENILDAPERGGMEYTGGDRPYNFSPSDPGRLTLGMVGGLRKAKEELFNSIIGPLKDPSLADRYGKARGGGILLYGPPGCGKTRLVHALANEAKASFFEFRLSEVLSVWYGKSEKNVKNIFRRARQNAPSIVFIDEIDAIGLSRGDLTQELSRQLLSQLLTEIDRLQPTDGVFVIAATNLPWEVDSALLRPGRFNVKILVEPPDREAREEILRIHTRRLREEGLLSSDVNFRELAEMMEGYSGADVMEVAVKAANKAWRQSLESGVEVSVHLSDFMEVIKGKKSSIQTWFTTANINRRMHNFEEFDAFLADALERFEASEKLDGYG